MSWKFIYEQANSNCPLASTNIDNTCYNLDNTNDFTCPSNYILENNKCINSLLPSVDPFCPNGYKNLNGKCTKLDGLPTCSDGYILFNNECKILEGTILETEYTCPDNYTVLGGLCV